MARRERLANNATSTLDGGINDSVTSLDVVDASDFPSEGDFRIVIGDEILLVTAVSSETFTVERGIEGTTAAAHSSAVEVCQVLTVGGLQNWIKENANPYALVTSKPPYRISDSSGDLLTDSDFTNFGSFTDGTKSTNGGIISLIQDVPNSGNNLIVTGRNVPGSTPWELTACIRRQDTETNNGSLGGICVYDQTSGGTRMVILTVNQGAGQPAVSVFNMNSTTSYSGQVSDHDSGVGGFTTEVWLRIEDDGTNLIYSYSFNGYEWIQAASTLRGAFLTAGGSPTDYGFWMQNRGSANPSDVTYNLLHWQE